MNIYVISNVWWRDGSTVIGAATDRAGAEAIGDRYENDRPRVASWAPWKEDVSPDEGSCTWCRDALLADGTVHPSLSQEIVCVPLAGIPDVRGLLADVVPDDGFLINRNSVSLPGPDPSDAMDRAMELILGAKADQSRRFGDSVERISVGSGAGLGFFQRAAETLPKPSPDWVWRVNSGDSIAGMRIVVDPAMRPDQIRIGSVVYTVGTGNNGVAEGTMIRVDLGEIGRELIDNIRSFTTEPG